MAAVLTKVAQKERLFILSFIDNGGNGTQAAIAAGFAPASARTTGSKLLAKPRIAAEIAKLTQRAVAKTEATIDRTLRENAALAFADPRRICGPDGAVLPFQDWPAELAAAVSSIEVEEVFQGRGSKRKVVSVVKKVRWWDKGAALERLFKFHKLYADLPPPVSNTTNILNVNFDGMDLEDVERLHSLLSGVLTIPASGGEGQG